ncbi:MAG: hypothetical protein IJI40_07350, partial [Firmicutes bacterium]|nr:hypothetical protein [Bacillota bacterium]
YCSVLKDHPGSPEVNPRSLPGAYLPKRRALLIYHPPFPLSTLFFPFFIIIFNPLKAGDYCR